jgi:hypothetical protein
VRSAAVIGCIAFSARVLGCDPSTTNSAFVDTDGDGISDTDEKVIHGTSPVLADTDGDGMSDYQEIVLHGFDPANAPLRFNPRIADVPLMDVRIVGPPLITLVLTDTNGETWSFESARTISESVSLTASVTESDTFSDTFGVADTFSRTVTVTLATMPTLTAAAGGGDAGADAGADGGRPAPPAAAAPDLPGPMPVVLTTTLSTTVNRALTTSITLSFSASETRTLSDTVTYARAYAATHSITASAGVLELLVEIHNRGNLPFRVTNLLLAASFLTPDGVELPVGNLGIDAKFLIYIPFSLAPGGWQGPVNFARELLTLDQVATLLTNVEAMKVRVGVYELSDAAGKPYAFDVPTMISRTATVDIDYGGQRPPERFLVATNLDPAQPGVTTERAFNEILRVPFENDPERGLTSVRNIATDAQGRWTVDLRHSDGSEVATNAYVAPYDFSDILLRAGDVLRLTWAEP